MNCGELDRRNQRAISEPVKSSCAFFMSGKVPIPVRLNPFSLTSAPHAMVYPFMIALSNKVTSMETDLNAVESTVNTDLPSLTTRVSDLEDQVDSLAGGSSALSFDVLFDRASTDENISFGYTGGWLGGVQRNFDLTKYTGLRFFATLGGMGAQYYVKLTNREKADFLMLASNSNASKLYFMKVNIPLALNRIQVAYTGTITINTDGTVERTQATSGNTSHFLSRIEGYF